MAFTVEDFQDLLRLLDEHPEWQAELRRRLLTDELLELPALVRQLALRIEALAEAQQRTEQRVSELAMAQARTEQRVSELAMAQERTEQRVSELAMAQERTEQSLNALITRVDELGVRVERIDDRVGRIDDRVGRIDDRVGRIDDRVGRIDDRVGIHAGKLLEADYAHKGPAYFSRIARRLRLVDPSQLANLLDDAVDEDRLTMQERDEVMNTDVVFQGRRREDQQDIYILIEVSWGIGPDDIERAWDRSRILGKLGRPVVPVVAGKTIEDDYVQIARRRGVWRVLNGHAEPPDGDGTG